jgi:ADP-dependent NAD(P)H-hydrate dehydratase / NAD(P)H-hydrate epimerase
MSLPADIFSVAQIRQIEAAAIAAGTSGFLLMSQAGAAAYALLRHKWPEVQRIVVVAGPGNNGGDGLVLARLAMQEGLAVAVMLLGDAATLRGEAAQAYAQFRAAGGVERSFDSATLGSADLGSADVVVDALLGIGVRAPLRPEWRAAIEAMNACGGPVFALDVPSGLDPDSGLALPAVRAAATISFIALKQGSFLGEGPEHVGELHCDALGVSPSLQPAFRRVTRQALAEVLPPRPRQSHKGLFGRVVIIGGGAGMPGAVRLTAEAALRVGAGLVTVASLPEHLSVVGARPELMFRSLVNAADVAGAVKDADVIVIGPGLGQSSWATSVLDATFAARTPRQHLVVDADALNLIAAGSGLQHCDDWVLTPHPGEAARLLGITTGEVQQGRASALDALCTRRGGTIVLKGASTLIGRSGEVPCLCDRGSPGMAVAGMGDVLTGAVAGLLAQSGKPFESAVAAVYAHALAGEQCARQGVRGVLALEVAQQLRVALAHLP